jgi:flagellar hook assembly protein FlgD
VEAYVYNILGQRVASLAESEYKTGSHYLSWDGRNHSGNPVPSGLYLCCIRTPFAVKTVKMIMMK